MTEGRPPDGVVRGEDGVARCWWCIGDPLYVAYHDEEWGFPAHDDRRLFEMLVLEGFQSGLSWLTVLRKRAGFRAAFAGFDPRAVAAFDVDDLERLVEDAAIVRHRGKIAAAIDNARRVLDVIDEFGSFDAYVWQHEPDDGERPATLDRATLMGMATGPASTRFARDLRRRGFRYVGATTVYAFMQAVGLVNDHLEGCAIRADVAAARR